MLGIQISLEPGRVCALKSVVPSSRTVPAALTKSVAGSAVTTISKRSRSGRGCAPPMSATRATVVASPPGTSLSGAVPLPDIIGAT